MCRRYNRAHASAASSECCGELYYFGHWCCGFAICLRMHWVATLLMSIIYVTLFLCCGLTFYLFGWTWLYDLYCCRRIDVAHDRIDPLTNILFMRYGDHKYLHPVPRRLGDLDFGPDEIIIRIPRPVPRYLPSMPRC